MAFSRDGKRIAVGHNIKAPVLVWSIEGEALDAQLEGLTAETTAIAFFPDGETVAASSIGLRFWKLDGSWQSPEMLPRSGILFAIAISPEGDRIASAGLDGLIYLWKPDGSPDGEPLAGQVGRVSALDFTAAGELISGGEDGKLRVWSLDTRRPRVVNVGPPIVAVGSSGDLIWAATRRWDVHFYTKGDLPWATLIVDPSSALLIGSNGSYSGEGDLMEKLQAFEESGPSTPAGAASEHVPEAPRGKTAR
jgi:WD40 repeat protein